MRVKINLLLFLGLVAALLAPGLQPVFAHEEHEHLHVAIDIRPGSYPNPINLKSNGSVPVALLGSAEFDVMSVDPDSVKFGRLHQHESGAYRLRFAFVDVNQDGFLDIVFHFKIKETLLEPTDTEACLHGMLMDATTHFCGHDSVKVIP